MTTKLAPTGTLRLSGHALPLVGAGRMYVCGVTPYDVTHLGHAATFVWADAVARIVRHLGVDLVVCRNVTDVDDVLTAAADRGGEPFDRFAAMTQFRFEQDMASLAVRPPVHEPRAHLYVGQVVTLASALIDTGAAYVRSGSVYFRGSDVPARAGLDVPRALELSEEFGDRPHDPSKDDPLDVAVWKASSGDEPAWDSPWGPGRPGWHAECAAMALTTFGPAMDLHAGGEDLRFPHHAYEAAMAEAVTGVRPFARAWMHVGAVCLDGSKMSKSRGNLVLARDLLAAWPAAVIRTMLLDRAWGQAWDYTPDLLGRASDRLEAVRSAAGRAGSDAAGAAALEALLDGLDVTGAVNIAIEAGGDAAVLVLALLDPDGTSKRS